jgi:lauroyl/myristoyl acyltransferase
MIFRLYYNIFLNFLFFPVTISFLMGSILAASLPLPSTLNGFKNIRKQLKANFFRSFLILVQVYFNFCLMLLESTVFKFLKAIIFINEKDYELFLRSKQDLCKPHPFKVLYLSAHYSNFEILVHQASYTHHKVTNHLIGVVATIPKIKIFRMLMDLLRSNPYAYFIYSDKRVLRNIKLTLQKNDSVALANDQKPKKNSAFIKFFNDYALFPHNGLSMAQEEKAHVLHVLCQRLWPGTFEIRAKEGANTHLLSSSPHLTTEAQKRVHETSQTDYDPHILNELSAYAQTLEEQISQKPGAWFWIYRKWSRKIPNTQ